MRRGSASASSATTVVAERHARLERVRHAGAVGLHEQVVDEVDADVDVLEPRELVGALGLRVAGAVDVERVEPAPRRPSSSAARASGEKISFQAWWRSSGGRCAARAKRFAL